MRLPDPRPLVVGVAALVALAVPLGVFVARTTAATTTTNAATTTAATTTAATTTDGTTTAVTTTAVTTTALTSTATTRVMPQGQEGLGSLLIRRLPAGDPFHWGIEGAPRACRVGGRTVRVSGSTYTTCGPAGDGTAWRDYGAQITVAGAARGATAIVAVRTTRAGRAELALGDGRYAVREHVADRWRVLAAGPLPHAGRRGQRLVVLNLAGLDLRVTIDRLMLPPVTLDPALSTGAIGFGLAPRGRRSVSFTVLGVAPATSVTTPTSPPRSPSTSMP